jgi:hypothetical protein
MLRLDLSLSDEKVKQVVAEIAGSYGGVAAVHIVRGHVTYARIQMNSEMDALRLRLNMGGRLHGESVRLDLAEHITGVIA